MIRSLSRCAPARAFLSSSAQAAPTRPRRGRRLLAAATIGVGCGIAAGTLFHEGFRRTLVFWANAFPIYARYRWTEFRIQSLSDEEQAAVFDKLHTESAPACLATILKLRGFYIKIGQMGATRADFVPPQFIELLETLQVTTVTVTVHAI